MSTARNRIVNHNQIGKMIIGDKNSEKLSAAFIREWEKNHVHGLKFTHKKRNRTFEPIECRTCCYPKQQVLLTHELTMSLENDVEINGEDTT